MRKITLYKDKLTIEVYESELNGYLKNGWSKSKPAKTKEVKKDA